MKKIFTLFAVALMAAPSVFADETVITVSECKGQFGSGFYPGDVLGTIKNDVTVSDGVYTINNFFGYEKANVKFTVDKNLTWDFNGTTRYAVYVEYPELPSGEAAADIANYTSTVFAANSAGTKFGIRHNLTGEDIPATSDVYKSQVITGEDADYIIGSPTFWCLTGTLTYQTLIQRTYAEIENGTTTVYFQGGAALYYEKVGEEWPDSPSMTDSRYNSLDFYASFVLPSAGSNAVETLGTSEEAQVEYYNLQGVRVANPENGIYVRRQGSKVEKVVVR